MDQQGFTEDFLGGSQKILDRYTACGACRRVESRPTDVSNKKVY